MLEFGANVIKLAISLGLFSKQYFKVILWDSSDPLSSKILLSVNAAATRAAGEHWSHLTELIYVSHWMVSKLKSVYDQTISREARAYNT